MPNCIILLMEFGRQDDRCSRQGVAFVDTYLGKSFWSEKSQEKVREFYMLEWVRETEVMIGTMAVA